MTKLGQDFTLWQGEDATVTFTVTDAAGDAVNLTGATLSWKATHDNTVITLTPTLTNVNGTNDGVVLTFLPATTKDEPARIYRHEGRAVSGGKENVIFTGKFYLKPSTTKPA